MVATGAVQKKVGQKDLNVLTLKMLRADSSSDFEQLLGLYEADAEQNVHLKKLRDALLSKLLSGEIDISKITG